MKVLVTGNLGYIGTVLTEVLKSDYDVVGFDAGFFSECNLVETQSLNKQIIKDIRNISDNDLKDIDYIIHLAALSNDPLGELNPNLTKDINFQSTKNLALLSKKMGVKRFVYVSSQSMYGISDPNIEVDEIDSEKKPVTEYAKTKWEAELFLNSLNDENFTVVSFRPSTVFGVSPRLRCDIVFNNLMACAYTTNKIEIKSDGSPWRPVIHVKDVVSALISGLKAPKEIISGKAYNVGLENGNYTVKDLADAVQKLVPNCNIVYTKEHLVDPRSYKVSFKRIFLELKDYYKPEWSLEKGGQELLDFFAKIKLTESDFRGSKTNRINNIKLKINNTILDNNLRYLHK
jgi:nucleoside-diphosphate-sugar epimerase